MDSRISLEAFIVFLCKFLPCLNCVVIGFARVRLSFVLVFDEFVRSSVCGILKYNIRFTSCVIKEFVSIRKGHHRTHVNNHITQVAWWT